MSDEQLEDLDAWVKTWWDSSIGHSHDALRDALHHHVVEKYGAEMVLTSFDGYLLELVMDLGDDDGGVEISWRLYDEDPDPDEGERKVA